MTPDEFSKQHREDERLKKRMRFEYSLESQKQKLEQNRHKELIKIQEELIKKLEHNLEETKRQLQEQNRKSKIHFWITTTIAGIAALSSFLSLFL